MGGRTYDRDVEVKRYGSRLLRRKLKERLGDNGQSGFLMLHGCGLCLVDGGAERAIGVGGCVLVMVEFEGKRERYQKQRDEERQFPVR